METDFNWTKSGAALLKKRAYLPWGPLPYPSLHAEVGKELVRLGHERARGMASWQHVTLDHRGEPLLFLFQEERMGGAQQSACNAQFLSSIDHDLPPSHFFDEELQLLGRKSADSTLLLTATGCKSGMGALLFKDVGFVNFGPHLPPLGECAHFGLAGRGRELLFENGPNEGFRLSFCTAVAAERGLSRLWVEVICEQRAERELLLSVHFEGFLPPEQTSFLFFGRGAHCIVSRLHKLTPRSLDRYLGPACELILHGAEGQMTLLPLKGARQMEIHPLPLTPQFWESDFLITFRPKSRELNFKIHF